MYHRYIWIFGFLYEVVVLKNKYWACGLRLVVFQLLNLLYGDMLLPNGVSWLISQGISNRDLKVGSRENVEWEILKESSTKNPGKKPWIIPHEKLLAINFKRDFVWWSILLRLWNVGNSTGTLPVLVVVEHQFNPGNARLRRCCPTFFFGKIVGLEPPGSLISMLTG